MRALLTGLCGLLLLSGCRYYKQDILFRTDEEINRLAMEMALAEAEKNYLVTVNDLITVQVYTNRGERLVDPNFDFTREVIGGGGRMNMNMGGIGGGVGGAGGIGNNQNRQFGTAFGYLVEADGTALLPMVGRMRLEGYSRVQVDSVLSVAYNRFYEEPFVVSQITNRRVFVLGAAGGNASIGRVIPLQFENMSLIEVLAQSGGLQPFAKAFNIRLIRGDLKNPQVMLIDLTTIDGMRQAELKVLPNDIIYVEPGRRPVIDFVRDSSTFFGIISSITSLTLTLLVLTNQLNP